MYIDVHAHLDPYFYKDEEIEAVIKGAEKNNVKIIVANGVNKQANRHVLELAKKYPIVKAALGIYPYEALLDDLDTGRYSKEAVLFEIDEELEFFKKHKKEIVALGEVGIDKKTERTTRKQYEIFEKIIALGKEINKPLIVHSRKAEEEVIEILEKLEAKKVIMHCFSGRKTLWSRIEKNGWYCSIPTNCVRLEHFQQLIAFLPLTHLFAETDSPFLSPVKEERNEPMNVVETYKIIAKVKNLELQEVEHAIFQNWQRLFL